MDEPVAPGHEQVVEDPSADAFACRRGTGQEIMLSDVAKRFVRRVEFEGEAVARWRPAGKLSPVVLDPEHAFGMPTVDGIATERIFELVVAGETLDDVAAGYEMPVEDVRAACAFEETAHSYAA